ncbi:MAG: alanine racemase [Clostridia bacterium]|nr:alanine racemase [Clostridia bacterium]
MKHWLRRTWAEIDLDALRDNFKRIRFATEADCRVMAVVKADAYGHGAVLAAETLEAAGADWFAVSNLDEALQLRDAGITRPILILSYTPPEEAAVLSEADITQTVVSADHAKALSDAAAEAGVTLRVHIKLDTGMSRVGFFCQADDDVLIAAEQIAEAAALPALEAEGIFTHFTSADEPNGEAQTRAQYDRFCRVIDALAEKGITFRLRHCCNSAATLRFPEMHLDMVRPGVILYGLYPDGWMRSLLPLQPVMSLKTRVSQTKTVPAGTAVSYGRAYTAERAVSLATVPIGYADGYTRRASGKAFMLIHGEPAPVRGRICMDQCMLDISGVQGVAAGDVATAFGQSDGTFLPVETYASWSDTINYEIVCAIGKRVPRLFLRGGQPVYVRDDLI